jgi:uncharacterized protein with GYD domain
MPKFAVFFTLAPQTVKRMMDSPSDRAAVVGKLMEHQGGRLEGYYFMFGKHDGMIIADLPDAQSAASASLAVSSTGAFGHVETHQLFSSEEVGPLMERAKQAGAQYTPPGA